MPNFTLSIKKVYAVQILQDKKVFEVRPAKNIKRLEIGARLGFHWCTAERVTCDVLSLKEYSDVVQMVKELGAEKLMPGCTQKECEVSWLWFSMSFR